MHWYPTKKVLQDNPFSESLTAILQPLKEELNISVLTYNVS